MVNCVLVKSFMGKLPSSSAKSLSVVAIFSFLMTTTTICWGGLNSQAQEFRETQTGSDVMSSHPGFTPKMAVKAAINEVLTNYQVEIQAENQKALQHPGGK